MFNNKQLKNTVVTFRHYDGKSYSAFNSLKKEIRIGVLAVSTLLMAHNGCLAARSNSLQIVKDSVSSSEVSLGEAVVTGSQLPVSLDKSWSKIVVISRQEIDDAKCQTINDILKLCPNVDVRQRGALGVQTDISLGGGTFDQITILLNGININNPQTGHLSADFPVAIADIERIEVLDGASARTFGSQALNGIINIITRADSDTSLQLHGEGGSYGTFGGGASLNLSSKGFRNRISADYLRTDGAVDNSAFGRTRVFYQGRYSDDFVRLNWQAGFNGQKYGANTFYSAKFPNQWEEGQRYMAAIKGETLAGRIHFIPTLSFTRNYDHFQLIKSTSTGENFHRNDVMSAAVSGYSKWSLGRTAFGGELREEGILSSNLGRPLSEDQYVRVEHKSDKYYNHKDHRTNYSLFLEHAVLAGPLSVNVGVMANRNTAVDEKFRFYPGVDLSLKPITGLKLYASFNRSMRMPTFTDLYYKSPTQEGNVGLKPEEATTCKVGVDYSKDWFAVSLTGIYRRGTNMIDWVMYTPDDIYHSAAFKLSNYQLVAQARVDFQKLMPEQKILRTAKLAYYYNNQKRHDNIEIYQSNYALDYLRHKVTASVEHGIYGPLSATWYLRWQDRMGTYVAYENGVGTQRNYKPYTIIDVKLRWTKPTYDVYASFENILARKYYDLGAVPQPRFTFLVGANYKFKLGHRN